MIRAYTAKHLDFLRENYPSMRIPELTVAFNTIFGTAKAPSQIHAALANHKIKSGRPLGNPVGTLRAYTQEQADFIRQNYRRFAIPQLIVEFNAHFSTNRTPGQLRAFTRNHRIRSGRTGCFPKGHRSWNAGTKGLVKPNSGNFKKGDRPTTWKPVGSERVDSKDGYLLIKTPQRNPYTGFQGWYRQKHVVMWEEINGPKPPGMVVAFKDGSNQNCTIENLMLITRAELLALNQHAYKEMPDELKPSVLAIAKLEAKLGKRVFA